MRVDLAGQVNAVQLAPSKGLWPLFEAVVNSVHAIQERKDVSGAGRIEIQIRREQGALALGGDHGIPDITGFEIIDDGAGFTDENFLSFGTSYSTRKAEIGGKGVGRLVWLKAFDRAHVTSAYRDANGWHRRTFDFQPTKRGVEHPSVVALNRAPSRWPPNHRVAPRLSARIPRIGSERCIAYRQADRRALPGHVYARRDAEGRHQRP